MVSLRKIIHIGILFSVLCFGFQNAFASSKITAKAWLIADENGKILDGHHTTDIRSIASITKLMTVMVVLDANQPLDEIISTKLYKKSLTRKDLIDLSLIRSDNSAAKILCETYITGYKECINAMNIKAQQLGMKNTYFGDSTGLLDVNVSTAEDLIKLVSEASNYPTIVSASSKDVLNLPATKKTKNVSFRNTNSLVGKGYDFVVTKTGFIRKAGGCVVFMINTERGKRTVVLLGSKNTHTRMPEARLISGLF